MPVGYEPMLARLLSLGSAAGALRTGAYAITTTGVSAPGDGAVIADRKFFGYGRDRFGLDIGGTLAPTKCGDYVIDEVKEYTVFNTYNATYGTLIERYVSIIFKSGPSALTQNAFTSLHCSGGQTLTTASAGFAANSDGAEWFWLVTTDAANEVAPDYLPTGTVTVTV